MTNLQNIDDFVKRWQTHRESTSASSRQFLDELCDALDLPRPEPPGCSCRDNTGSIEPVAATSSGDGFCTLSGLDLFRCGRFALSVKRSQIPRCGPADSALKQSSQPNSADHRESRSWENSMQRAKRLAEAHMSGMPQGERRPPFLIVVELGHCFDVYSELSATDEAYLHFPDPRRHRIMLADLVKPEVIDLFHAIWTNPQSLDPSLRSAKITEKVAAQLCTLATMLEKDGHNPKTIAQFLMRCCLSMLADPTDFQPWAKFANTQEESSNAQTLRQTRPRNLSQGIHDKSLHTRRMATEFPTATGILENPEALPLRAEHLRILAQLDASDWSLVEPATFGSLLEQALNPKERHKRGAHYTPRKYVDRLIIPTLISPLRDDWDTVQAAAAYSHQAGNLDEAQSLIRQFRARLLQTNVLDPACGTGNFLYVAMEHLKRLECEVLHTMSSYGDMEPQSIEVGPHQFHGLEVDPIAAQIAEMVLWFGHLRWNSPMHGSTAAASPPIETPGTIQHKDALLEWTGSHIALNESREPIRRWDRETYIIDPITGRQVPDGDATVLDTDYIGVTAANWPKADFIIGNPPFIGGKDKKQTLGDGYFHALAKAYPMLPESCDFVMYWWHKAAQLVRTGRVRRFGFITTNSISQVLNRRVLALHMESENPLHLVFAVPDHPWVDAPNGAAVRIAMTVAESGPGSGTLATVQHETETSTAEIHVALAKSSGVIHANLRQGVDLTLALPLLANRDLCSRGMVLHGSGFIVTPSQATKLGLGRIPGLDRHIRPYRNGKDIAARSRGVMVIDLHGLSAQEVQDRYPEVYHWVFTRVKPERDHNRQEYRRQNWWLFGGKNTVLRAALAGLSRYISTVETSKHRYFIFLPAEVLPDNKLVNIASKDAFHLGILSSRVHRLWASVAGSKLGTGGVFVKSACFDTFPFPDAAFAQVERIRCLGESLDAHRKSLLETYPNMTMTSMYNALEALRIGGTVHSDDGVIHNTRLVCTLDELHDDLDTAVANAYGIPADLPDDDTLCHLLSLNADRAREEKQGNIRWLRPDYQSAGLRMSLDQSFLDLGERSLPLSAVGGRKPNVVVPTKKSEWPTGILEQTQAVRDAVARISASGGVVAVDPIADCFIHGSKQRIRDILHALESVGLDGLC
ncbi:MAG: hypothetical protein FWD57_01170 [Polyangiaceae bacterium]|nr:hypothetical protein [Polyangiaceae bacterium]